MNFKQYLIEEMGIKNRIRELKSEFAKVDKVDPTNPAFKKLQKYLDSLDNKHLKMLRDADIKWISSMARLRLTLSKAKVKKSKKK